jgi:hypothetical protein
VDEEKEIVENLRNGMLKLPTRRLFSPPSDSSLDQQSVAWSLMNYSSREEKKRFFSQEKHRVNQEKSRGI